MDRSGNNFKESSSGLRLSGNVLLEKEFLHGYLSDSIELMRVGLVLLLTLCLLSGLGDVTGPVDIAQYMPLIGIMLAITLILLLSIGFTEFFIQHYCLIINFVLLLACMGIPYCFFERCKQYGGDKGFLMVVMIVLTFWVYQFSRLGLMRSLQWGCLIAAIYIMLIMPSHQVDQANLLIDMIILIIVNIAGLTYSYDNEKYARLLFYEKLSINKLF